MASVKNAMSRSFKKFDEVLFPFNIFKCGFSERCHESFIKKFFRGNDLCLKISTLFVTSVQKVNF